MKTLLLEETLFSTSLALWLCFLKITFAQSNCSYFSLPKIFSASGFFSFAAIKNTLTKATSVKRSYFHSQCKHAIYRGREFKLQELEATGCIIPKIGGREKGICSAHFILYIQSGKDLNQRNGLPTCRLHFLPCYLHKHNPSQACSMAKLITQGCPWRLSS